MSQNSSNILQRSTYIDFTYIPSNSLLLIALLKNTHVSLLKK